MQLLTEVKTMRVADEDAAIALIEKFKQEAASNSYEVTKSAYVMKTKKSKGEVIDMWYIVTVTINYDI